MKVSFLFALLFMATQAQATILSSATTCRIANIGTEITIVLDENEEAYLEIMVDQANITTEDIVAQNYRQETVDAYGVQVPVAISEYTSAQGNKVTFFKVTNTTNGKIQGPLTQGKEVGLYACRTSVEWDY